MSIAPFIVAAAVAASPIFTFETGEFWLNLHHFLYVLGRADARLPDASRDAVRNAPADAARAIDKATDDERRLWAEAVAFYAAGPSRKDLIFDDALAKTTSALASVRADATTMGGASIDPPLAAALLKAAPVYRKLWWPEHQKANADRKTLIEALVARHGAAVLAFLENVFGMKWPEAGYPVHLSGYSNWAGAYSTTSANMLVVSSLDPALQGLPGLEIVFHEGMHQWDDGLFAMADAEARALGKRLPPNITHALIFFTAGEAVRRVVPEHVPYADANGIWAGGMGAFHGALLEAWKPYLDGRGTRQQALAALVAKTATRPRQ